MFGVNLAFLSFPTKEFRALSNPSVSTTSFPYKGTRKRFSSRSQEDSVSPQVGARTLAAWSHRNLLYLVLGLLTHVNRFMGVEHTTYRITILIALYFKDYPICISCVVKYICPSRCVLKIYQKSIVKKTPDFFDQNMKMRKLKKL